MSDNQSKGGCYESTGTIHLKIQIENRQAAANALGQPEVSEKCTTDAKEIVFFVPDDQHCVTHEGNRYAMFLPARCCNSECSCQSHCSCQSSKAKSVKAIAVPIGNCVNSVKLYFCDTSIAKMNKALLEAALKHGKVDVMVRRGKPDKNFLILAGITVPARQPTK